MSDLGFDGDWVSPYQIGSRSPDGPVLVADNWLDVPSFRENETILRSLGYLPGIKFNNVLDIALSMAGLKRAHIYVTPSLSPAAGCSITQPWDEARLQQLVAFDDAAVIDDQIEQDIEQPFRQLDPLAIT